MAAARSTNSLAERLPAGDRGSRAFWQISDGGRSCAGIESLSFDGRRMTIPERAIPVDLTLGLGHLVGHPALFSSHTFTSLVAYKASHLIALRSHRVSYLIIHLSNSKDGIILAWIHDFPAFGFVCTNPLMLVIANNRVESIGIQCWFSISISSPPFIERRDRWMSVELDASSHQCCRVPKTYNFGNIIQVY